MSCGLIDTRRIAEADRWDKTRLALVAPAQIELDELCFLLSHGDTLKAPTH